MSDDPLVWQLYENGYTVGINQVEQDGSRKKCMAYKPKNISELAAFVAAIRPGFKSMYKRFENREDFSWGIPTLDNLIRTKELPVSFLFFQEQVMSVLNYAGFPMDECYGIIKAIAKKHPEKVKPLKQKFIDGFRERLILDENLTTETAQENAEKVWTIVNDNCGYGFNSAHAYCMALDSLYQAWQKVHYPYEFYEVLLQHYSDKGNKAKVATLKAEMKKGFGIKEGEYKFRNDNRSFASDKERGVIYPSLASIKNISQKAANSLYKLGQNQYDSFIDLLLDIKKEKITTRQMDILVKLDYFSEFGEIGQLLQIIEFFEKYYERSQIKKVEIERGEISEGLVRAHAEKETPKMFSGVNGIEMAKEYATTTSFKNTTSAQKAYYQWNYLGYVDIVDKELIGYVVAMSVNAKYSPRLSVYALANGNTISVKVPKPQFRKNPIEEGDVLKVFKQKKRVRSRMNANGEFEPVEGEYDWWITDYDIQEVDKDR